MSNPLVSVIIPNYNHARFLDERIQTVLNQTYQDFEVIILDDKSTDNSLEVINKYKDNPHISHIVVNEENSGSPFKQWHRGFALAKGEWIWIAESDDSCKPEFLNTLMGQVNENTSYAFCRSTRIDEHGKDFHENWQDNINSSFEMDGYDFFYKYLGYKNIVWNASSVIFRKENISKISNQYTKYKCAGDWLFWILLSFCGNVVFINDIHNFFRLHSSNTTQKTYSSGLNQKEQCFIYDYLLKNTYIKRSFYDTIRKTELTKLFFYSNLDETIKKDLFKLWNLSFAEMIVLKLKKFYVRMLKTIKG